ncbi:non-canonical purine NTP pyrophosphatase [Candidatus Woesearchaeota archaeon]|nr:non-canonical purine NTP pyrophosphatase [Candidatus Woesearchaeota archaeon]
MTLYFITTNKNKFSEAKILLKDAAELKQLKIDLDEIQEIDQEKIIGHKLKEAQKHKKRRFIVEDTSLVIKGMKGLPGPLTKWFIKTIDIDGIARLKELFGDGVTATSMIGYSDENGVHFFEGKIKGKIVSPRGRAYFQWDRIFVPQGYDKTFAEMSLEEKNKISHRSKAFLKLKSHLVKPKV